jgi:hypothetical protein
MRIFWLIVVSLAFLLTGCGNDDVATAVNFLQALNQRDVTQAAEYVCPERQDEIVGGLLTVSDPAAETFNFQNVSCSAQGDGVLCRYTIDQLTEGADLRSEQYARQVVFAFEDGRICGFEEQVAE